MGFLHTCLLVMTNKNQRIMLRTMILQTRAAMQAASSQKQSKPHKEVTTNPTFRINYWCRRFEAQLTPEVQSMVPSLDLIQVA